MHSKEPGGNYSAVLKDLMARRAALNSAITKLQGPQAGCNVSLPRMEASSGKRQSSYAGGDSTAN
jgi:hypothetical protein